MIRIESPQGLFYIRPYRKGDERLILQGWKQAFGKEMSLEEWRWKYEHCPGGFRCLLCTFEEKEIAVHYAAQVYPASLFGEKVLGLHLTDTFSLPAYRWAIGGKYGLLVKVGLFFLKSYLEEFPASEDFIIDDKVPKAAFHYGFPGVRHFRLGELLLHYRKIRKDAFYLRWNSTSYLKNPLKKRNYFSYTDKLSPKDITIYADLFDKFWEKIEKRYQPFAVIRNWQYIKWRYLSSPKSEDYIFFIRKRGLIKKYITAWAVGTPSLREENVFSLLEVWAENERELEDLLFVVLKDLHMRNLNGEVWLSASYPWIKVFFDHAFYPSKEPLGIIPGVKIDRPGFSPDLEDRFWWTMGESDLF